MIAASARSHEKHKRFKKALVDFEKAVRRGDRRSIADARVFLADYRDALKKEIDQIKQGKHKRKIRFLMILQDSVILILQMISMERLNWPCWRNKKSGFWDLAERAFETGRGFNRMAKEVREEIISLMKKGSR